ncbi:hypothetical protein D3C80_1313710 [compost metagenome]
MDAHTQLQRYPAHTPHQLARLHTGRGWRKPAFEVLVGTGQALHLGHGQLGEGVDAVAFQCGDHTIGRATLGGIGGCIQRTIEAVIGLHPILLAEGADGVDALLRRLDQAHRFLHAEQALEGEILGRPGERATTVATAGTGATDIGFDQQDVEFGVLLLEHDGGPQAGVTTTDDAHVTTAVAGQGVAGRRAIVQQRLLEPERPHGKSPSR